MKINLLRETLLEPLQMVIGVVERKQATPILSNVLINVKGNYLSIIGTDSEIELKGSTTLLDAMGDNRVTLPGRKLVDICRSLPEHSPMELYQDKERVVLRSGHSRFTLSTLPAEEFPSVEKLSGQVEFLVSQSKLRYLLQRTYFAMAQQDVRYYLNGLLLEVKDKTLLAVATDGHRLAANAIVLESNNEQHRLQVIIPRKAVLELIRILDDSDEVVTLSMGTHHARVFNESFEFTSKLVDGRFPDYRRVIPKHGKKNLVTDRQVLKNALSRTAILCNEKFRGVRFELRNNLLRILSNNPEQETAEEELVVDYAQEDLDIGFNVNYLVEILGVLKTETIQLNFSDSNSSVLVEEVGGDENSIFVVMPMRL